MKYNFIYTLGIFGWIWEDVKEKLPSLEDILTSIEMALRNFFMYLCKPVYQLIGFTFNIFELMGDARILENNVGFIFNRVSLILGLFMVFRITLYAIQYVVNPDNMFDEKVGIGNIIKKSLITVILLGSVRFMFDEAYLINSKLVHSRIIDILILGPTYVDNYEEHGDSGHQMAWYAFSQFYKPDEIVGKVASGNDMQQYDICDLIYSQLELDFMNINSLDKANMCVNSVTVKEYDIKFESDSDVSSKSSYYIMEWEGLLCLVAGIFLLWTIITYTIQLGVRLFQLAYLELIAPIPIMMYLLPDGDEKLKSWAQQCLMTFLDYFIRLAILDFIIVAIGALTEITGEDLFLSSSALDSKTQGYIVVIMLIAMMQFAKKVPSLIQELLPFKNSPGGMSYGFGLGGLKKAGAFAAGTVGAGVGLAAGGLLGAASGVKNGKGFGGKVGGALGGLGRGMYHGSGAKDLVGKVSPSKVRGRVSGGIAAQRSAAEARNKAIEAKHSGIKYQNAERENQIKRGKQLFEKHGDNIASAFKSSDYAKSYQRLSRAKSNVKTAKGQLAKAEDNYNLAMRRGDANSINNARITLGEARKASELAQKQLDAAKNSHDKYKETFKSDAKIENDYDTYKDSLKTYRPLSDSSVDANNIRFVDDHSVTTQSDPTTPSVAASSLEPAQSLESSSWSNKSVEPYVSPQKAEEQAYDNMLNVLSSGASDEEKQAAMNKYNEASSKRQELDNNLDDFYDHMDDIGGGFGGGFN